MKKSTTQMTKSELIQLVREQKQIITELENQILDLKNDQIGASVLVADTTANDLIKSLISRIKYLEKNQDENE